MISQIRRNWPPKPLTVGTKTQMSEGTVITFPLTGMIEQGWWTGLRISTSKPALFNVRIVGFPAEWTQHSGHFQRLFWPIPGGMDVTLEITCPAHMEVTLTACYHTASTRGDYVFTNTDGGAVFVWNGRCCRRGQDIKWRTIHTVIPPLALMDNWEERVVCIHSWDERMWR